MIDSKLLGPAQPDRFYEQDQWEAVVAAVPHLGITAYEAKALYAFPMMRQFVEGTKRLLDPVQGKMDLPAYVLLADGIEALGRCLIGCQETDKNSGNRLKAGLERLERRETGDFPTILTVYSVPDCVKLRNFTTHGGTTPRKQDVLSGELTALLVNRFADELTDYWVALGDPANGAERDMFAAACIRPLFTQDQPVHVAGMFDIMTKPGAEAGQGLRL